ncbi:hypothetical protein [Paraburkholderia sp. J63]|uniref:hypothetical protein n=1 Tax=Paraburkholderia sp. J63 TaxID=2805434 RepID=UPI002ABDCF3C|nr:hypothetical protein [Paraburkholderia sp. J63]
MKPAGWILLGTLAFVAFAVWSESVAANTAKPAAASIAPVTPIAQTAATPTIAIVAGTWGANCGARRGNATRDLARHCNGLPTCGYVLGAPATGAPSPQAPAPLSSGRKMTSSAACRVDYRAQWRCGNREFHDAALSAGASPGDTLVLSCVHENGPGH